jgi:hypothetical protein
MKALTLAAVVTALLAIPAYSQNISGKRHRAPEQTSDPTKKKADDKAYNDVLSKIPAVKEEYDPWQGVRQKSAAPTKTGH